ncbi:hypothetical protein BJ508DRAFT_367609 [Ascobolus immersus RN42]|uniref:Uncharacterized protein n=1 Tax=Ascobolus immersus RN42 TaxID=1160509 RepID=A0A3N4HBD7_ASCIM|nr:hypothetical protein BJ508DRAFT_367609 [Ascobolus immersus RN42]
MRAILLHVLMVLLSVVSLYGYDAARRLLYPTASPAETSSSGKILLDLLIKFLTGKSPLTNIAALIFKLERASLQQSRLEETKSWLELVITFSTTADQLPLYARRRVWETLHLINPVTYQPNNINQAGYTWGSLSLFFSFALVTASCVVGNIARDALREAPGWRAVLFGVQGGFVMVIVYAMEAVRKWGVTRGKKESAVDETGEVPKDSTDTAGEVPGHVEKDDDDVQKY